MEEIILPLPFKVGPSELSVLSFMIRDIESAPFFLSDVALGTKLPGGNVSPVLKKYVSLEVISCTDSLETYMDESGERPRRLFRLTRPGIDVTRNILTGFFLPKSPTNPITYIRR